MAVWSVWYLWLRHDCFVCLSLSPSSCVWSLQKNWALEYPSGNWDKAWTIFMICFKMRDDLRKTLFAFLRLHLQLRVSWRGDFSNIFCNLYYICIKFTFFFPIKNPFWFATQTWLLISDKILIKTHRNFS